jgi:hypothetical protein
LRIRRLIGVENRRRIYRFVEDSRRRWGVEDAALSPRDFFNGLLIEAPSLSTYPFSYQQCRWQMVIDGNEICTNTATLLSMEFRPDQGAVSTPFSGTVLMPQIDFYVTNTTPVGMTTTYAQNWGNASPTTVYSIKTLNIPSSTGSFPRRCRSSSRCRWTSRSSTRARSATC